MVRPLPTRTAHGHGRSCIINRVALRPEAELEGATPDEVIEGILAAVPVPR